MFARHHQPPPSGVINARSDQPVGINASCMRPSASSGDSPLSSSTIAATATVSSILAKITGTSATSVAR
jgi:hypothetical protein